jgi:hypothetical protein
VSKQQLVMTEVPLHIASFTSHFDPKTTSLFQAVKNQTFLMGKKPVQTWTEKTVILMHSIHHILLSNAVRVTFVPKAQLHQFFPYHCTQLPSQIILNYYMKKLTSAINKGTTIIIPLLLDNLRRISL